MTWISLAGEVAAVSDDGSVLPSKSVPKEKRQGRDYYLIQIRIPIKNIPMLENTFIVLSRGSFPKGAYVCRIM